MIEEMKRFFPDFLAMEASRYNVSIEQLFDEKPGSIRQFMQNFGTDLRRSSDPRYWARKWEDKMLKATVDGTSVVVDDVRFKNEAITVRSFGGKIVQVIRQGQTNTDTHASETEMSQIKPDYVIFAEEGHPEQIEQAIQKYVESLSTGI